MQLQLGTLHIVRNFYTTANEGVYDVTFTRDDHPAPEPHPILRRFVSEQELTEFLGKHLDCPPGKVAAIMRQLSEHNHARVPDLRFSQDELRRLKLAA